MKLILAPHKILLHIYPKAAASFMVRNPDTPNKGIAMKRFILGMVVLAGTANAASMNYCNNNSDMTITNTSNQPFYADRRAIAIPATGLAPSITLPAPVQSTNLFGSAVIDTHPIHVAFLDNTISATFCLDGVSPSNILCNAGVPPANSVTATDAWQPVPPAGSFYNPVRNLSITSGTTIINNPSATIVTPGVLYISSTGGAQTAHIGFCQEY